MSSPEPDESDSSASLDRKVRRGSFWLGANSIVMRFSNIAVMAVVARIVIPEEFGVFTLAVVAQAMIATVAELGVASAIARRDLDENAIAPTAVTVSVGIGILLGGLLALFAEPIAIALGSVEAAPALRILAISVALSGLFVVPSAQLQRDFRQSVIFRTSFVGSIVGSAVLIVLAVGGNGAEAFAWSRVVGQLITGILVIIALSRRYGPGWNRESLSLLLKFGLPLALANLLSQVVANVDYLFVGHTLALRDVGLYTLAFNISSWATSVLSSVLNGIVLPAFSAVRGRNGDVQGTLFLATRSVALVAFPIAALTSGLALPLIVTVYGERWAAAAPVVVILSVYGAAGAIGQLVANLLIASGRTGVLLWVQVAVLIVLVPALWIGITTAGLVGVGLAHVVTVLVITLPVYLFSLNRALRVSLLPMLRGGAWPLLAAILAGGIAYAATLPLSIHWVQLLVGGACGGIAYLLLTYGQLMLLLPAGPRARAERLMPRSWRSTAPVLATTVVPPTDATVLTDLVVLTDADVPTAPETRPTPVAEADEPR